MMNRKQAFKIEHQSLESKEMAMESNSKRKFLFKIVKATAYVFPLICLSKIDNVVADEKNIQSTVNSPKDISNPTTVKSTPTGLEEQPKLIRSGRVPDLPGVRFQQATPSSVEPRPK